MRLIDHSTYRVWHHQMATAWRTYDRSTAYGCAQADRTFEPDTMAHAWAAYTETLQSIDWTVVDRDL